MHSYSKDVSQEWPSPALQDFFLPRLIPVVCQDGGTTLTSTLLLCSLSPWLRSILEISPGETVLLLPQISPHMWRAWSNGEEEEEVHRLLNPKVKELAINLDKVKQESDPQCETTFDELGNFNQVVGVKDSRQTDFICDQSEEGEVGTERNKLSGEELVEKRGRGRPRKLKIKNEKQSSDHNNTNQDTNAKENDRCALKYDKDFEELTQNKNIVKVAGESNDSTSSFKKSKISTRIKWLSFECNLCGKDFENFNKTTRNRAYNSHTRWCAIQQFSCDCPGLPVVEHTPQELVFEGKSPLSTQLNIKEKHMKEVHLGLDWFQCMKTLYCNIGFKTSTALEIHTNEKHPIKTNNSEGAKQALEIKKALHESKSADNKEPVSVLECDECGKTFTKLDCSDLYQMKKVFQRHKRVHNVVNFKCDCQFVPNVTLGQELKPRSFQTISRNTISDKKRVHFTIEFLLKEKHMKVEHTGWYGCATCIKCFKTNDELLSHKEDHNKSFVCESCGFVTDRGHKLMTHEKRTHDNIPKACPKCDLTLENEHFLKNHMNSSHVDRTMCSLCGESFRYLELHIQTRHKSDSEKKYQCSKCGKGFLEKYQLEAHIVNLHTKTQPHKCRFGCENSYNDQSNRNVHERRKHGRKLAR